MLLCLEIEPGSTHSPLNSIYITEAEAEQIRGCVEAEKGMRRAEGRHHGVS